MAITKTTQQPVNNALNNVRFANYNNPKLVVNNAIQVSISTIMNVIKNVLNPPFFTIIVARNVTITVYIV